MMPKLISNTFQVLFIALLPIQHAFASEMNVNKIPYTLNVAGWYFKPETLDELIPVSIGTDLSLALYHKAPCCSGNYQTSLNLTSLNTSEYGDVSDIGMLLPPVTGLTKVEIDGHISTFPEADYSSIGTIIPIPTELIKRSNLIIKIHFKQNVKTFPGMWKEPPVIDHIPKLVLSRDESYIFQKIIPLFFSVIFLFFSIIFIWLKRNPKIKNPIYQEYIFGFLLTSLHFFFLSGIPRTFAPFIASALHYPAGVASWIAGFRIIATFAEVDRKKINLITKWLLGLLAIQIPFANLYIFHIIDPIGLLAANFSSTCAIYFLFKSRRSTLKNVFLILAIIYNASNYIDTTHLFFGTLGFLFPIPYLIRITGPLFLFMALVYLADNLLDELANSEKSSLLNKLSTQVSHDIRSPLAALEMISGSLQQLPEDKRTIIRNSINRIRDIANDLLSEKRLVNSTSIHSAAEDSKITTKTLLSTAIDAIVTEKRIQYRNHVNTQIEFDQTNNSYGLFADLNINDFKRVLSNLINNAVEALPEHKGIVRITLLPHPQNPQQLQLTIADNGKGIPAHLLPKLGTRGETHGKESGHGLGLSHAKETLENNGGSLQIESQESIGTTITLTLPRASAPDWFVSKLTLIPNQTIIVFDDDQSVHQIWKNRIGSLLSFSHANELRSYYGKNFTELDNALFLMDYEISGSSETGLDLIETLGIQKQSILVTSRYEEKEIRDRCERLGVKLLPKLMSGFVPIETIS